MGEAATGFEGETVLRIEPVDTRMRDRCERVPPWRVWARIALLGLLGAALLGLGIVRFLEEGIGLPAAFAGMMGVFFVVLSICAFRRRGPSVFENMDRYIFTDQRIALVDASGAIINQIPADQLGDMTCDKRYQITIHWADDPTRDRIFPIFHLGDYKAVSAFIADNYRILSHEPAGWPQ